MIAVLGYVHEIEERLAAGWKYEPHHPHPVLRAYGRMYFYREDRPVTDDDVVDYARKMGAVDYTTLLMDYVEPLNKLFGTNFTVLDPCETCFAEWRRRLEQAREEEDGVEEGVALEPDRLSGAPAGRGGEGPGDGPEGQAGADHEGAACPRP